MKKIFILIILSGYIHLISTKCIHSNSLKTIELKSDLSYKGKSIYLIPVEDYHLNNELEPSDRKLQYVSGFNGSVGLGLIDNESMILFTNEEHRREAINQLYCGWTYIITDDVYQSAIDVIRNKSDYKYILLDYELISYMKYEQIKRYTHNQYVIEMMNPFVHIPSLHKTDTRNKIYIQPEKYSGKSWREKVKDVLAEMNKHKIDEIWITSLENIAWLLNLRGSDIPRNPLFKSIISMDKNEIRLYIINPSSLSESVKEHLKCNQVPPCVVVKDYLRDINNFLHTENTSQTLLIEEDVNFMVYRYSAQRDYVEIGSLISDMRIKKNPTEIAGMKQAHILDSLIISQVMSQENISDELSILNSINNLRSENLLSKGESFKPTIAFGSSGEWFKYTPDKTNNKIIENNGLLSIHTGGQYLIGTTQVGRTFSIGRPSDFQKQIYTRLLMGFIDFINLIFPKGSSDIDLGAKTIFKYLHEIGIHYPYDMGHGIGAFLKYNEKPFHFGSTGIFLEEGMSIAIEIGHHEATFGILFCETVVIKRINIESNITFYTFEPISMMPLEYDLIKLSLLSSKHINWINYYNDLLTKNLITKTDEAGNDKRHQWIKSKIFYLPNDKAKCPRSNQSNKFIIWPLDIGKLFIILCLLYSLVSNVIHL